MSVLHALQPLVDDVLTGAPARSWLVLTRAVDYLGTSLFVGGSVFLALLWPAGTRDTRARCVVAVGLLLGLFGTLITVVLQTAWIHGTPVTDATRWEVVARVLDTGFGQVWAGRSLLWALAVVVLADLFTRNERAAGSLAWRLGALVVCGGLLRTLGMTGHAGERDPTVLGIADLVHVTGVSLWVGGLAVLLFALLPRRRPEELAAVLPRFSKVAFGSVLAVLAGGVVLSAGIVGTWANLIGTSHGQLLLVKVGILGVVLAAALVSKRWVDRRLGAAVAMRGDATALRPLIYSVTAETVVIMFALLAAGFLVTASPGR